RENGEVSGHFQKSFNLKNGFTWDAMVSMLCYLGVLSPKGKSDFGEHIFGLPNESMRVIFNKFYLYMISGGYTEYTYSKIQRELVENHNLEPLRDELNKMLAFNSNRDARYFNESNLKTMLSAILYNNPSYVLKSELEFNGGYADVAILPDHVHQLNHYYLFELEYLPVGEALGKSTPMGGQALGIAIPMGGEVGGQAIPVVEVLDKAIPVMGSDGKATPAVEAGGKITSTGEVREVLGKATTADGVGDAAIEGKLREARAQLQRYMKDPLVSKLANLHKYIIVASLRGVLKVEEMKA
ncbi:MAG: PD-(D/E)XK nuclease domain-containing protein, partial [Lachnospiraceae bacterium]|nr:PD-(D/E)XK nuclease domain-containing protein [Lachnospiraceae bacterium]